jgi:hypothetical protein
MSNNSIYWNEAKEQSKRKNSSLTL